MMLIYLVCIFYEEFFIPPFVSCGLLCRICACLSYFFYSLLALFSENALRPIINAKFIFFLPLLLLPLLLPLPSIYITNLFSSFRLKKCILQRVVLFTSLSFFEISQAVKSWKKARKKLFYCRPSADGILLPFARTAFCLSATEIFL